MTEDLYSTLRHIRLMLHDPTRNQKETFIEAQEHMDRLREQYSFEEIETAAVAVCKGEPK